MYTHTCRYAHLHGLHISLGIFYRLFSLLENECHELDIMVASEDCAEKGGASYGHYAKARSPNSRVI